MAHLVAEVDYFVLCEAEEPHHVRVGAEAAVPHADSVLGRQPGCHQAVRETLYGEGRKGQGVGAKIGPEDAHSRDGRQAIAQQVADVAVVGDDRRPAQLGEAVDRSVQRYRPDDVRRARLLAFGRVVPDDVVKLDQVDRAATG